ncbi:MAG: helix-turn-helix domain-containing protein, partial [Bdellovibrionota bacterium]
KSQSESINNSAQTLSRKDIDSEIDDNSDLASDLASDSSDTLISDENLDDLSDEDISIAFPSNGLLDFNAQKEEFEKQFIIKALKTFKGRINQTAIHANIPKKTLLRKIEKYGIVAKEYAELKN